MACTASSSLAILITLLSVWSGTTTTPARIDESDHKAALRLTHEHEVDKRIGHAFKRQVGHLMCHLGKSILDVKRVTKQQRIVRLEESIASTNVTLTQAGGAPLT